MKCSKCGTVFQDGVFCPECGTKVIELADKSEKQKEEKTTISIDEQRKIQQLELEKEKYQKELELELELKRKESDRKWEQEKRKIKEENAIKNEGKTMAVMSVIMGVIALVTLGCFVIPDILGIIFALNGKKQGQMLGMAKAGLVCSIISVVLMIIVIVCAFVWG